MNHISPDVRSVHLIAACGTGMGALAAMLKEMGLAVTGSDQNVYPPMSTYLESRGVRLSDGFDAANLAYRPDLVVVGNAVKKDNPEARKAIEMGLAYCSMPQAVNYFLVGSRQAILVAGTHGKTTTAAMIAWLLHYAGLSPSFMIGGFVKNFAGNYYLDNGSYVVLEADEYDTAFFDKQPKFMHYDPAITVLTSVEFDHADIYQDLGQVKSAFEKFLSGISPDSRLIAYDADANIDQLLDDKPVSAVRYGSTENAGWRFGDFFVSPPWLNFDVMRAGKFFGRFKAPFAGEHNLRNALSAIAVASELGVDTSVIAKGLERFDGVKRRQEVRGVKGGVTVIDDFAHHPTAVFETIRAIRPFYPEGRLIAVFEPRTNTSMRKIFQGAYAEVFDEADSICIRKPPLLAKIPEGERFSSERLVADLKSRGKDARYFEETEGIISYVAGMV
ncbi:MAG: UDP-N-acetylmuramate--L-alanine ligase, partial [Desulfobacterales bacterium]